MVTTAQQPQYISSDPVFKFSEEHQIINEQEEPGQEVAAETEVIKPQNATSKKKMDKAAKKQ